MKGRILLVDDNEAFLDSTKDVLEDEGYEVVTASSGEDAIREIENEAFHVVLMDIKMPGLNGVEAFVQMKRRNPRVKVIMCTAYIVESLIRKALSEGAAAVLSKPFEMDLLLRTIDRALAHETMSILVADRDRDLCERLSRELSSAGHRVAVAAGGAEALKVASARRFDILILDVKLPEIDGIALHRLIKRRQSGLLATLLMGSPDEMDPALRRKIGGEKGVTGISKPLDMIYIRELLQDIRAAGNHRA